MPHQEAPRDVPITMEQDIDEDDLLRKEMVDCEASSEHIGMEINVIIFLANYNIVGDNEFVAAQLDFGPREMVFTKPKEPFNHLKPLYMSGHIDGTLISKMLVHGGATVNLMPYPLY